MGQVIKTIFNADQIIAIRTFTNKRCPWYELHRTAGTHWWKLFGIIPIYKYTLTQNTYHTPFDHGNAEPLSSEYKDLCIGADGEVYYKPHLNIYFPANDIDSWTDCGDRIYFETEQEMYDAVQRILDKSENCNWIGRSEIIKPVL